MASLFSTPTTLLFLLIFITGTSCLVSASQTCSLRYTLLHYPTEICNLKHSRFEYVLSCVVVVAVCVCVCPCSCVYTHVCTCTCGGQMSVFHVFLCQSPSYLLRQGLSPDLAFPDRWLAVSLRGPYSPPISPVLALLVFAATPSSSQGS